jgi:hypothetical protein
MVKGMKAGTRMAQKAKGLKKRQVAKAAGGTSKERALATKVERHRESRGQHLKSKDMKQRKSLRKATKDEAAMLNASKKKTVVKKTIKVKSISRK